MIENDKIENRNSQKLIFRLWDAATSQLLTTLISHDRRVTDLQFRVHVHGFGGGDDGDDDEALFQLISVSEDQTLKVTRQFIEINRFLTNERLDMNFYASLNASSRCEPFSASFSLCICLPFLWRAN